MQIRELDDDLNPKRRPRIGGNAQGGNRFIPGRHSFSAREFRIPGGNQEALEGQDEPRHSVNQPNPKQIREMVDAVKNGPAVQQENDQNDENLDAQLAELDQEEEPNAFDQAFGGFIQQQRQGNKQGNNQGGPQDGEPQEAGPAEEEDDEEEHLEDLQIAAPRMGLGARFKAFFRGIPNWFRRRRNQAPAAPEEEGVELEEPDEEEEQQPQAQAEQPAAPREGFFRKLWNRIRGRGNQQPAAEQPQNAAPGNQEEQPQNEAPPQNEEQQNDQPQNEAPEQGANIEEDWVQLNPEEQAEEAEPEPPANRGGLGQRFRAFFAGIPNWFRRRRNNEAQEQAEQNPAAEEENEEEQQQNEAPPQNEQRPNEAPQNEQQNDEQQNEEPVEDENYATEWVKQPPKAAPRQAGQPAAQGGIGARMGAFFRGIPNWFRRGGNNQAEDIEMDNLGPIEEGAEEGGPNEQPAQGGNNAEDFEDVGAPEQQNLVPHETQALEEYLRGLNGTNRGRTEKDSPLMILVKSQMQRALDELRSPLPKTEDEINEGSGALASTLMMLANDCDTYVSTHKNPKTGDGRKRLEMVRMISDLSKNMAFGASSKAALTALYLGRGNHLAEDHTWGQIYTLSTEFTDIQIKEEDKRQPGAPEGEDANPEGQAQDQQNQQDQQDQQQQPEQQNQQGADEQAPPETNIRRAGALFENTLPEELDRHIAAIQGKINALDENASPKIKKAKEQLTRYISFLQKLSDKLKGRIPKELPAAKNEAAELRTAYLKAIRASNALRSKKRIKEQLGNVAGNVITAHFRLVKEMRLYDSQSRRYLRYLEEQGALAQDHVWSEMMSNALTAEPGEGGSAEKERRLFSFKHEPNMVLRDHIDKLTATIEDAPAQGIQGEALEDMKAQKALAQEFKTAFSTKLQKKQQEEVMTALARNKERALDPGVPGSIPKILGEGYANHPFWTALNGMDQAKLFKAIEAPLNFMQERDMLFEQAELKDGTKTMLRGVAVNRLANALGIGSVVQNADLGNMQKGEETMTGVFSENKKGTPLGVLSDRMEQQQKTITYSAEATKQLTDLQILDYLCNNFGRNLNNILVEFHDTEAGVEVTSIKGYDNNASFGTKKAGVDQAISLEGMTQKVPAQPGEGEEAQTEYTKLMFEAMDPKMVQRISDLPEEALAAELAGLVSDEEIEEAKERLKRLKEIIDVDKVRRGDQYSPDDDSWKQIGTTGYAFKTYFAMTRRAQPQA